MATASEDATQPQFSCQRLIAEFSIPLPPDLAKKLDDWESQSTSVKIFVIGKTGTGKSTLVNKLVGSKVAKEGQTLDAQTSVVEEHQLCPVDGIIVTAWDSPGLQDGTKNEKQYLRDIQKKCKDADLFIYCIRMNETRFVPGSANPDITSMKKLTSKLGKKLWDHTIIVLTFANRVVEGDTNEEKEKNFMERYIDWKDTIYERLRRDVGLPEKVVKQIKVIPAGYKSKKLPYPEGDRWLTHLWLQAVLAMESRARPAMIKINQHRFAKSAEEISKQKDLIFEEKAIQLGKTCRHPIDPEIAKIFGECKSHGESSIPMLVEFFYFQNTDFNFLLVDVQRPPHSLSTVTDDKRPID